MEAIVANVDNMRFDIEVAIAQQLGAQILPFPGMDKSGAAVCEYYAKSSCQKGGACPFRHVRGDRTIVCKHWLRGLCKKGDQCEFLHEYDMSKMPECYFYSRFNACHNKECPFLHIDPESRIRDCPWYDRGFCRHGPNCRHRHVRRVLCLSYLAGFCSEGPSCKHSHPRFELPAPTENDAQKSGVKKGVITCHYCGETGHKVIHCGKLPPDLKDFHAKQQLEKQELGAPRFGSNLGPPGSEGRVGRKTIDESNLLKDRGQQRPLEEVTCYKCGSKGHYANKCPKGHLAFLSQGSNQGKQ